MKQLDYEDKQRYRKIAEVRNSATIFADGAEQAFAERDGTSTGGDGAGTSADVGAFFHREAEILGGAEANLDQARFERLRAWTSERRAARGRRETYVALRGTICAARQFGASQTGDRAGRNFGLKGPTPRHPEKLASWGRLLSGGLREARIPAAARPLAAAFAAEIDCRVEALESALELAELEKGRLVLANRQLRKVRREVDAELSKSVRFLRVTLERVGLEELGVRVLGRRRGRPRKSVRARRQADETLPQAVDAGRKVDETLAQAVDGGRKVLDDGKTTLAGASAELRKIDAAPSEASTAGRKIEGVPSKASTAPQKIEGVPGKGSTSTLR